MIDGIPMLAWSCLPDGTCEFLNKQWFEYTGLCKRHWAAVEKRCSSG